MMKIGKSTLLLKSMAVALALTVTGAHAETNLEFIQWWEPELPAGALRGIMDEFEAQEPRHQGHPDQRSLCQHARPDRRRRRVGHAQRCRRSRRRLGQRPRQAGRDRRPQSADRSLGLRREPGGRGHQGRRRQLHVPRRVLRLSGVHEPRPPEGGRRGRHAVEPDRVRRRRTQADRRVQEPVWLGPAAVAASRPTASRTT